MAQEVAPFLREQLLRQYGGDVTAQIESGYAQRRLTTLRVNRLKAEPNAVRAALAEAGIAVEDVAWSGDALVLPEADGRAVTALPLYARGEVYMQSLSSMLPPLLLGAHLRQPLLQSRGAACRGGVQQRRNVPQLQTHVPETQDLLQGCGLLRPVQPVAVIRHRRGRQQSQLVIIPQRAGGYPRQRGQFMNGVHPDSLPVPL